MLALCVTQTVRRGALLLLVLLLPRCGHSVYRIEADRRLSGHTISELLTTATEARSQCSSEAECSAYSFCGNLTDGYTTHAVSFAHAGVHTVEAAGCFTVIKVNQPPPGYPEVVGGPPRESDALRPSSHSLEQALAYCNRHPRCGSVHTTVLLP